VEEEEGRVLEVQGLASLFGSEKSGVSNPEAGAGVKMLFGAVSGKIKG